MGEAHPQDEHRARLDKNAQDEQVSYCQELCTETHAASCSTRSPSLKAMPCMTSVK